MSSHRFASLFLVACVAFFGWALARRFVASPRAPVVAEAALPEPGETLAVDWAELGMEHPPTGDVVLVFLSADCPWSRVSLPAVGRLGDELARHARTASLYPVVLGDTASARDMMRERGAEFSYHVSASYRAVVKKGRIARVPFTLLVTPGRSVRATWRGRIDRTRVREIVAAVDGTPRPGGSADAPEPRMTEVGT